MLAAQQLVERVWWHVTEHTTIWRAVLVLFVDARIFGCTLKQTSGRADAFMMDDVLLAGEKAKAKNPDDWVIVGEPQSFEIYGCMMRKGDPEFKEVVDEALANTFSSGEINDIYNKWFLSPIPPKNVNLNFEMSDNLKALLADPHDGTQPKNAAPAPAAPAS